MKSRIIPMLAIFGLLFVVVLVIRQSQAISDEEKQSIVPVAGDPLTGRRTPVLVELFTSEGCSSCPPADEVLLRLDKTQPVPGADVIALSEHVDYWNRLGWADPYSSADFSRRQAAYADAFRIDGNYTPQMIVDGQAEFVGSNAGKAREAIMKAAQAAKATVQITRVGDLSQAQAAAVPLQVHIEDLAPVSGDTVVEVLLAITEDNLHSSVLRGENSGRLLKHTAVVRRLIAVGEIKPHTGKSFDAKPTVNIAGGWKRENLRAVVFLQERESRRVLGAAAIRLVGD
jgi:hypothetical protein